MSTMQEDGKNAVEFVEISKSFPGVQALDKVSFGVREGEVHALVGENGAGKTTLMNLLSGALQPDSGSILWRGEAVEIPDPRAAQTLGISTVYQDMNLCPNLTVAGNVFVGRELVNRNGTLDWDAMNARVAELMDMLDVKIAATALVRRLSVSAQQLTEIAKGLGRQSDVIILDEPTSALSQHETETLFAAIRRLKGQGVTVLYVSHRMEEIFQIADRVTVLRDGKYIGTRNVADTTIPEIVLMMVGRQVGEAEHEMCLGPAAETPLLQVDDLTREGCYHDVSFSVHCGEIVGFFGLQGSGKSELGRSVFGLEPIDSGSVLVDGRPVHVTSPRDAIRHGMGFVPSDRRGEGLMPAMDIRRNVALVNTDDVSRFGLLDARKLEEVGERFREKLDIVTPSLAQKVANLSGGNQQKVILARWLAAKPRLLIMDEPTRGIDVGAKAEIHKLLHELAGEGLGIMIISSELPEIMSVSDRVVIMFSGRMTGEFNRDELTAEEAMSRATRAQSEDVAGAE